MLDAYEFATIFKEARDGAYLFNVPTGSIDDPYEDRPQTYHRVDPLITAYLQDKTGTMTDTDWQDAIFRTAYSTKHSVSVSGRTKTLGYYVGANYLYREGTIIGSDFERYSLRANIDGKRNRLKYGVSFSPSYSKTNYISSDTQYNGDGVIASGADGAPGLPGLQRRRLLQLGHERIPARQQLGHPDQRGAQPRGAGARNRRRAREDQHPGQRLRLL